MMYNYVKSETYIYIYIFIFFFSNTEFGQYATSYVITKFHKKFVEQTSGQRQNFGLQGVDELYFFPKLMKH